MNAKTLVILSFTFLTSFFCQAQETDKRTILVSVFNNATSMPFSGKAGIIHVPLHPGFTIGTSLNLNKSDKNQLFQNFKLGYFYHRFAQHGAQLYTESGYRRYFAELITAEARIGAGYMHSFPDNQIFVFKDGEYKRKTNWGRPQFMASLAFGPGIDLERKEIAPVRIFLDYQIWFQMPFVNNYVPVLPNVSLHLGAAFKI